MLITFVFEHKNSKAGALSNISSAEEMVALECHEFTQPHAIIRHPKHKVNAGLDNWSEWIRFSKIRKV